MTMQMSGFATSLQHSHCPPSPSLHSVNRIVGAPQSQGAAQGANANGLAGVNIAGGVQAQVGQVCVNALNSAPSC